MNFTIEQIAEQALTHPVDARTMLADLLIESLDPLTDVYIRQLWTVEAHARRDDVRRSAVTTIAGQDALAHVRKAFDRCNLNCIPL